MKPIIRKELYLNKIVGNNDYETPEKPIPEEEFFFAEILGEAVQAPEPLPRYQMYLAKIAGREIEIPYPEVRLEYFLARAAGMDVETPTPITREEIYWSNYTAIVEFELEGVPPLSFKAKAGALKDYRIYGQTSRNLFDGTVKNGNYTTDFSATNRVRGLSSTLINIGDTITVSNYSNINLDIAFCIVNENGKNQIDNDELLSFSNRLYDSDWQNNSFTYTSEYSGWLYLLFKGPTTTITKEDVTNIMLNSGSTPLPYEPYGESVGDRTGNLFDYTTMSGIKGIRLSSDGYEISDVQWAITDYIPCDGLKFTINKIGGGSPAICLYDGSKTFIAGKAYSTPNAQIKVSVTISSNTPAKYIRFSYFISNAYPTAIDNLTEIMLNSGSTALPYEPYGYKVPVTVSDGIDTQTIPIYLPEQIRKVGDEAEYIDYTDQKLHRVGVEDIDVTLPELPTVTGTNVLTVGTTVRPSKVYIKGEKERD